VDRIKHHVAVARRRLIAAQFLEIIAWSLSATLLVTAVGLAVPKIWALPLDSAVWNWSWVAGGLAAGVLIACVGTWILRRSSIDAAIEIDRRCQLKERISSVLSLAPEELDSEIGRALVQDAIYRVERVDVRDRFAVSPQRRILLPLLPAALIGLLLGLVPDAVPDQQAAAANSLAQQAEQVKRSAKKLQEQLDRVKRKAEEKGLADADVLFRELRNGLEELVTKTDVDHKKALVTMNDLAKSLQDRRDQMGGVDKMRDQLQRLKDLGAGPADKIAEAMKASDFQKALDELKNLQEKLKNEQLGDEEKQQLMRQLEQMQNRLQELKDSHEQAKRDLEQEIQRRQAAGDLEGAGKLQRQLDQRNRMNEPMDALQKMAQQLGHCRECLQNGDGQAAAAQLDQMARNLQEMQQQADQRETLQQMLGEIAMAKEAMGCQQCDGQGCEACVGQFGNGRGQGQEPGFGLGDGQGQADRPEAQTDTAFYESHVKGKVQPGEVVRTGSAAGPNQPGQTLQQAKDQLQSSFSQEADPLIDLRLPKKEREHTRDYFRRYREGE
jgi:hypothetical protein